MTQRLAITLLDQRQATERNNLETLVRALDTRVTDIQSLSNVLAASYDFGDLDPTRHIKAAMRHYVHGYWSPELTLTEQEARQQIDAAERVSRMYFKIAADVLGEEEVRRRRDDYLEHDLERVREAERITEQSQPVPEGWKLRQEHGDVMIVAPDSSGAWYDEASTKDRIVREFVGALLAAASKPEGGAA